MKKKILLFLLFLASFGSFSQSKDFRINLSTGSFRAEDENFIQTKNSFFSAYNLECEHDISKKSSISYGINYGEYYSKNLNEKLGNTYTSVNGIPIWNSLEITYYGIYNYKIVQYPRFIILAGIGLGLTQNVKSKKFIYNDNFELEKSLFYNDYNETIVFPLKLQIRIPIYKFLEGNIQYFTPGFGGYFFNSHYGQLGFSFKL